MIAAGSGTSASPTSAHHLFCSGHALLPDGRRVIMGRHGDDVNAMHLFDPARVAIERSDDMRHGVGIRRLRFCATGRAAVMSDSQGTGPIGAHDPVNGTVQVFDVTHPSDQRLSAEEHMPSLFSP